MMILILLISFSSMCIAGDYSQNCNNPECDPSHAPVPNIFTAMTGYNILLGNPLPESRSMLKDPGFTNMEYIFVPTVKNAENRYALDAGLTVKMLDSFQVTLESEIIKNTRDYQKSLEKTTSSSVNLATYLESEITGKIGESGASLEAKTKVPPFAEAAFESNNVFRQNEKFFTSKDGIIANARAHCITYSVKISQVNPPKFHPNFIQMLKELQSANGADDNVKDKKVKSLIENFGTHYMKNVDMGARIAFTKRYDRHEAMKTTEQELKECIKDNFNVAFGLVKTASSTCTGKIESSKSKWTREFARSYATSFGSKPKKDLHSWAAQEFTSPIPVQMTLDPIVNLFREVFMGSLKEEIHYEKIIEWLLPKYLTYCEDHRNELQIATCDVSDLQQKGCGWNDDCEFDQECKNSRDEPEGYTCINQVRTYQIMIKTSNINWAGTDSDIHVTIVDEANVMTDSYFLDDEHPNFDMASTDKFDVTTRQRLGVLKKIILKKNNGGSHPGWHLNEIKIKDVLRDRVFEFPADRWIAAGTYTFYEKSKKSEWNSKKKKFMKINRA